MKKLHNQAAFAVLILMSLFASACSGPSSFARVVPLSSSRSFSPVEPGQIEIMRGGFPEGIKIKDNVVSVAPGYEDKIVLVGKVEASLSMGLGFHIPLHKARYFYAEKDEGFVEKYCRYNYLTLLPWPPVNYLNPLAWPCFAMTDYSGANARDVDYREKLLEKKIRDAAAAKGANLIFNLEVLRQVNVVQHINEQGRTTGFTTASTPAWEASGFAARIIGK